MKLLCLLGFHDLPSCYDVHRVLVADRPGTTSRTCHRCGVGFVLAIGEGLAWARLVPEDTLDNARSRLLAWERRARL